MNLLEGLRRIAILCTIVSAVVGASVTAPPLPDAYSDAKFWAQALAGDIAEAESLDLAEGPRRLIEAGGGSTAFIERVCARPQPAAARVCAIYASQKESLTWRQLQALGVTLLGGVLAGAACWLCWLLLAWVLRGFTRPSVPPPSA